MDLGTQQVKISAWGRRGTALPVMAGLRLFKAQGILATARNCALQPSEPSPGTTLMDRAKPQKRPSGILVSFLGIKNSVGGKPDGSSPAATRDSVGLFQGLFEEMAHLPAESLVGQEARTGRTPGRCPSGADWAPQKAPQ